MTLRLRYWYEDYNNARVLDFKDVPNYTSNAVSILETARMPWHDVSFLKCIVIYVLMAPIGPHDDCWTSCSRYYPTFYGEVE